MNKIRSIILLTFMSVMCMSVRAAVDDSNVIYSKAINAHPTDAIEIPVYLNNKNYGVKSLQFTIVLPDGMSFVSNGTNYKFTKTDALNDDWTVTARTKKGEDSHSAIVMVYNTNDDAAVLPVADKEILSLSVKVDDDMALGDYNVTIKSVTLTSADNTEYTYPSYTNKADVTVSQLLVSNISLNKSSLTIDAIQKDTLTATIMPEKAKDKTVTWTSSNEKVAKVSKDGVIEAIVGGTATITATANDGSGVKASCTVTVVNPEFKLTYKVDGEVYKELTVAYTTDLKAIDAPTKDGYTFSGWSDIPATMPAKDVVVTGTFTVISVSSISLNKSLLTIDALQKDTLTATVLPTTAKDKTVTWTSSNEKVAKVSKDGVIEAIVGGTATITATANDGSGVTASCKVTVVNPEFKLTYKVDGEVYKELTVAYTTALKAIDAPTKDGYTFSGWSDIPATMPANDVVVTGTFTVISVSSISLNKSSLTIDALHKDTLTATVLPATAKDKTVTWTSSNEKVAKVSKDGVVEAIVGGTATITATANDGSGVKASCTVTVVNPEFKLTYKVDGEIYKELSVAYTTALKAIDAPTKDGYTFSGWSDIPATMPANDVVVTGTFKMNPIKINPIETEVKKGDSMTLGVEAAPGVQLKWRSSDESIAVVDDNGYITFVGVGSVTITVSTTDGKNSASCTITVTAPRLRQDVNEDSNVDTQDVLDVYEAIKNADVNNQDKYDVNNDGTVDTQDILDIYEYIKEN